MKSIFQFSCVTVVALLGVASCKQNESIEAVIKVQEVVPDKFIEFNGTTVRLPSGASEKLFLMESPKEIMRFAVAEVQKSSNRVRVNAEDFISKIPGAIILEILQRESKKYPKLDFSKEQLDENVLVRIKKDFPAITTQQDAFDKSETIAQYYDKLLRDDLIKELSKIQLEKARTEFFDGFNPPGGWGWIAIIYPTTSSVVGISAVKASNATKANFGDNFDGEKSNAFRHSVWNALSVGNMRTLGYSRSTCWDNVKNINFGL